MNKAVMAGALVALGFAGQRDAHRQDPALHFKEERLAIEYTATAGEASIVVEAESEEQVQSVDVHDPDGTPVFRLRAGYKPSLALSGFVIETRESDLKVLLESYPEGTYAMRGFSVGGQELAGSAMLSHELLAAPVVTYPVEGAVDVPLGNFVVRWNTDARAEGYRVSLEQGENDGLIVQLPAGSGSFVVPGGLLEASTDTQLEIAAIASNGNSTLVEIEFTTR